MAAESNAAAHPGEFELVITRLFDVPRELVWKAWTDPEHRVRWMGPQGFTGSIVKMDLRSGGAYRFRLHSADGTELWQQGVYREVVAPGRIVCTYVWTDAEGNPIQPETLLTITFEEHGGKTRLTLYQVLFESAAARDSHRGGWTSSLQRLAEYLAKPLS